LYFIYNKGFHEECDKAKKSGSGPATAKRRLYSVLSNVTYSPTHRQAGALNYKQPVNTSHCFRFV